ncbi:MAG: leucine-rich repeat protein, partial [Bacillota bacterium]|nr:leucine-rich repeat protein [Bacillota bacterium]
ITKATIGANAFDDCTSLADITFSQNVRFIGQNAFVGTPWYNALPDGYNYLGDYFLEYRGAIAPDTEITLDPDTSYIGFDAFRDQDNLISIVIPDSVVRIYGYAFYGCDNLETVIFPSELIEIGIEAFKLCRKLTSADLASTKLNKLGSGSFSGCAALVTVTLSPFLDVISSFTFNGCGSLTAIHFPKRLKGISDSAFENCTLLKDISFEDESLMLAIGTKAFRNCAALDDIVLPTKLTDIGIYAFSGCSGMTSIVLPATLKTIGHQAFYRCSSLVRIVIPSSVTLIEEDAFIDCDALSIYCQALWLPVSWDDLWNSDNRPVTWNYKGAN